MRDEASSFRYNIWRGGRNEEELSAAGVQERKRDVNARMTDRVLYESMLRGASTLGLDMFLFLIPARPGPTPSSCPYSERSGWWVVGGIGFSLSEKCQCFIKRQVTRSTRTDGDGFGASARMSSLYSNERSWLLNRGRDDVLDGRRYCREISW